MRCEPGHLVILKGGGGSETGTKDFTPLEDDATDEVVEIDGEEDGHEDVDSGDNGSGEGAPKRTSVTGDAVVNDVVLDRSCGRAPEESGSRYGDVEHGVERDVVYVLASSSSGTANLLAPDACLELDVLHSSLALLPVGIWTESLPAATHSASTSRRLRSDSAGQHSQRRASISRAAAVASHLLLHAKALAQLKPKIRHSSGERRYHPRQENSGYHLTTS
ncbi:hypothetical protein HPB50_018137 [Hyalomma asiaticum]|uniref:Uncharacterized protein n=1 Tax=Hyalomma asiaticum TaxID=266040 RepID=A0ACB7T3C0_HYAAI|nr:hypothetical protein HPB50_018137 [Hyalomma asiaticum]